MRSLSLFVSMFVFVVVSTKAVPAEGAPINPSWTHVASETEGFQTVRECVRTPMKGGKDGATNQNCADLKMNLITYDGKDGKDGKNGRDGAVGPKGRDGRDGQDGKDGKNGAAGPKGRDGKDGEDGRSVRVFQMVSSTGQVSAKIVGPDGTEVVLSEPSKEAVIRVIKEMGVNAMSQDEADQRYASHEEVDDKVRELRKELLGETEALHKEVRVVGSDITEIKRMISTGRVALGNDAQQQPNNNAPRQNVPVPYVVPQPQNNPSAQTGGQQVTPEPSKFDFRFGINAKVGLAEIQSVEGVMQIAPKMEPSFQLKLELSAGVSYLGAKTLDVVGNWPWISASAALVGSHEFTDYFAGEFGVVGRTAGGIGVERFVVAEYAVRAGVRLAGSWFVGVEYGGSPKGWLTHPDGHTNKSLLVGYLWE